MVGIVTWRNMLYNYINVQEHMDNVEKQTNPNKIN